MKIIVVNKKQALPSTVKGKLVYVGRTDSSYHFGNPFTHLPLQSTKASVHVSSRDEAIRFYGHWLSGDLYPLLEVARREWIKSQIIQFAKRGEDLILQCYCAPEPCHGDTLRTRILDAHHILLPRGARL